MERKLIFVALGVLIVGAGSLLMWWMMNSAEPADKSKTKPVKKVLVQKAVPTAINLTIDLTGRLLAREKIEVFSEVTGKMLETGKPFKEGVVFSKGEALLQLDNRESKLALVSERSNFLNLLTQVLPDLKLDFPYRFGVWETFAARIDPMQALPELPEVKELKERNFLSGRNLFSRYYTIKSQEVRLAKFTLTAPFGGVVSLSQVNPGTLVRSGQKLGEYINPGDFELEAAINVNEAAFVKPGDTVALTSADLAGQWTGQVIRIGKSIDPATQTLKIFVGVQDESLKEGLYLNAVVQVGQAEQAIDLPRNLLTEDQQLFVVDDTLLALQPVEVVHFYKDRMVVRGVRSGTVLLNELISGAYHGMRVQSPFSSEAPKSSKPASKKEG
ncbi:MAG: efflux RND transporter periplasmic adaptor subunit [Salibacteraceae bacterium]